MGSLVSQRICPPSYLPPYTTPPLHPQQGGHTNVLVGARYLLLLQVVQFIGGAAAVAAAPLSTHLSPPLILPHPQQGATWLC